MRSGAISLNLDLLRNAGLNGYYWPKTNTNTNQVEGNAGLGAYLLIFNVSGLAPSNGPYPRYVGLPVRCLASGD